MNHLPLMFGRTLRILGVSLALGLAGAAANAAIVRYDFTVTIDGAATGPSLPGGQTYLGSLAFNDSLGMPGLPGETAFDLTAFSFDFNGMVYSLPDLFFGQAIKNNTMFVGADVTADVFSLVPGDGSFDPFFAYDLGGGDAGFGSVVYVLNVAEVPEPGSAVLALAGLALLGLRRYAAAI